MNPSTLVRTQAPEQERLGHRAMGLPWVEAAALLLAPVAAFFGLQVVRMARVAMIDPYLYSGYLQNGRDLITRYGDGYYYGVRLGFILPARASYLAFGAVPGFYVFRYVLALVAIAPTYLLFRRLYGWPAGALAVAVVLSSPVVLWAWGTDYPDSAAISYLFAGTACLVMPAATGRRRLAWVLLAGVALTLTVHSQVIAAPLVGGVVLAYVVVNVRRAPAAVLGHLVLMALCFLAVTAGLAGLDQWVFGTHNIIMPTIKWSERFRTPEAIAIWHSTSLRWLGYDTYLLVPPAVIAGWGLARIGGRSTAPAELTVVMATAVQGLAYGWLQFFASSQTLENHLWSSMLWPGVCLVTAFLLVALCTALIERPATAALPAVLVVGATIVVSHYRDWVQFVMLPVGVLIVAGMLGVVATARVLVRNTVVAVVCLGLVAAGCFALTIGKPRGIQRIKYPQVQYANVIGRGDGQAAVDTYRLASRLPSVIPPARFPGDDLLLWYPPNQPSQVSQAAAHYLWNFNSLRATMPDLPPVNIRKLARRHPRLVVLLSQTGDEFPAALRALAAASFEPSVLRTATFRAGSQRLAVWVVELGKPGHS